MSAFEIQEGNKTIDKVYCGHDNFKEIMLDATKEYCFVFFSSNGIYFPNEYEIFHEQIERKNRFEWTRLAKTKHISEHAGKLIFLRDVYKSWYVSGINKEIDSIDKIVELLRGKTEGYKVVMVGSSAGGYAATVCGILLNAERVINFGGQFSLYLFENSVDENYQLKKYSDIKKKQQYYDLKDVLRRNMEVPVIYLYAGKCEEDIKQWNHVKGIPNIYEFAFDSSKHADTTYALNNPYLVTQTLNEWIELYKKFKGKLIERNKFCIQTVGILEYLNIVRILGLNKIRKKFTKNRSTRW